MVCGKCEKKLKKLATTDTFRPGKSNIGAPSATSLSRSIGSSSGKVGSGATSRVMGKDKRLGKKDRFDPLGMKCTVCKVPIDKHKMYCHMCAYKKGICAGCGKQILDTKGYKQSAT